MTTPGDKARAWREGLNLTRAALGEKIGYAPETVYWMERFAAPPNRGDGSREVKPWVWLRYQRACQGLDAELKGVKFKW